jgi:hypothetical protein
MKCLHFAAPLFLFGCTIVHANPEAELDAAIRALLDQSGFRWKVSFERTDNGRSCGFDGHSQQGGLALVTTLRRNLLDQEIVNDSDRPAVIAYAGEWSVTKLDDTWLTPRATGAALMGGSSRMADVLAVVPLLAGKSPLTHLPGAMTTVQDDQGRTTVPRPDLILFFLRGNLENVAPNGRAITADITERGVSQLFVSRLAVPGIEVGHTATVTQSPVRRTTTSSRTGTTTREILPATSMPVQRPAGELVTYRGRRGTGIFWIGDGVIAKFELQLEGEEFRRGQREGSGHHVVITANIDEVGTTEVELPPDALRKLRR